MHPVGAVAARKGHPVAARDLTSLRSTKAELDPPEHAVVDDDDQQVGPVLHRGAQLVHGHLEASVAGDHHRLAVRPTLERRGDACTQCTRSQVTGRKAEAAVY